MMSKENKNLTSQIRGNLWSIVKILYDSDDYDPLYTAADRLSIERERARQAFKSGKGTEVLLGLILDYYGVDALAVSKSLPKLRKMMDRPGGKLTVTEELIEEARRRFSDNEFIAELRTIIARDEIRTELGLKKRAGRPRKKT